VRYPVSKTGGPRGLGGSTPSPSVFVPAWSSGYDARLLIAKGRFEPCRRSSICLLVVGELATPPASGAGDRRFDSCRPDFGVVRTPSCSAVEERLSSRAS
jgi:hypothetical protein